MVSGAIGDVVFAGASTAAASVVNAATAVGAVTGVTVGLAATATTGRIADTVAIADIAGSIARASITPDRSSITGIGGTVDVVTGVAAGQAAARVLAVAIAAGATGEQT